MYEMFYWICFISYTIRPPYKRLAAAINYNRIFHWFYTILIKKALWFTSLESERNALMQKKPDFKRFIEVRIV